MSFTNASLKKSPGWYCDGGRVVPSLTLRRPHSPRICTLVAAGA